MAAKKNLVIVESPAKAKTIEKILGDKFQVMASVGHVIDLPQKKLGVDVEDNFKPSYSIIKGKEEIIIGAGLAGSEAAYQLAERGIKVKLYEMRPLKTTEAHKTERFGELVCSNSLGGDHLGNASGLMKEELRRLNSLLIKTAVEVKVPAGQALAVDREGFSEKITNTLKNHKNIEIIHEEITEIPKDKIVLIASGPLTSEHLSKEIQKLTHADQIGRASCRERVSSPV